MARYCWGGEGRGGKGRGQREEEHSSSDKYCTRPLFPYVHITKSARAHSGASFTSGHVNYVCTVDLVQQGLICIVVSEFLVCLHTAHCNVHSCDLNMEQQRLA